MIKLSILLNGTKRTIYLPHHDLIVHDVSSGVESKWYSERNIKCVVQYKNLEYKTYETAEEVLTQILSLKQGLFCSKCGIVKCICNKDKSMKIDCSRRI